ncbi:hypothetical protein [Candidatus Magnetaquicoccus inordinatus]|uniref:hypothetical protein n=1 Tax=Candidatus Magnetaquicoccus inordinatus TaxID=2496818 RepID=UPI00102C4394|nr:hypothetical protein [Candidatus Magnetaquicoccus inordinatus]
MTGINGNSSMISRFSTKRSTSKTGDHRTTRTASKTYMAGQAEMAFSALCAILAAFAVQAEHHGQP